MVNVALVVSDTVTRFRRVRQLLVKFGLIAVHLPAVFVNSTASCRGTNGHRLAMRNAWNLVYHSNVSMGVFEDDVAPIHGASVQLFKRACKAHAQNGNGITFVENAPGWYRNAAMLISPRGAYYLLKSSTSCLRKRGVGVDSAHHNQVCAMVRCQRFKGIFYQDRQNVKPYLHDANNRFIR
jgi:hypothetical protein